MGENGGNASDMIVEGSVSASFVTHAPAVTGLPAGLNEMQSRFVDFYCGGVPKEIANTEHDVPPGDGTRSAIAAGYGGGAANMATRNLLKPKIQAEIEKRVRSGKGSGLLAGITALHRIIERGTDERAVVTAAVALLDRFGMAAPKGPAVTVNNLNMTGNQAQELIAQVWDRRQQRLAQQQPAQPADDSLFDG